MAEDASSTTDLFDRRHRQNGHPRPEASPLPSASAAYQPLSDEPASNEPLVRYEWRTANGDVLVVEAAWPTPPATAAPPTTNPADGADAAKGGQGVNRRRGFEPHVDLRQETDVR